MGDSRLSGYRIPQMSGASTSFPANSCGGLDPLRCISCMYSSWESWICQNTFTSHHTADLEIPLGYRHMVYIPHSWIPSDIVHMYYTGARLLQIYRNTGRMWCHTCHWRNPDGHSDTAYILWGIQSFRIINMIFSTFDWWCDVKVR